MWMLGHDSCRKKNIKIKTDTHSHTSIFLIMARRASNTPKKKEKTQHNTTHEIQTDTELTLEDEEFHGERWIKKKWRNNARTYSRTIKQI